MNNICVRGDAALVYYKSAALIHQANLRRLAVMAQTR
jgi:hypothetical protein